MVLEIFLRDLNEEAQEKVLKFFEITEEEKEANLDVVPLFIFEVNDGNLSYDTIHPEDLRE